MQLTFSPALGRTTTVKVPPVSSHVSDEDAQVIRFEAAFDSHESYLRAKSDGVKVELWTDLPLVPHGGSRAGWAAVQFTDYEEDQDDDLFRTPVGQEGGDSSRQDNKLLLLLRLPLQDHVGSRFQFTYRLVYPSGHIYWMGSHDSNGTIVVEQGLPGLTLAKGWDVGEDGRYHLTSCPDGGSMYQLETPEAWTLWAWRPGSVPMRLAGAEPVPVRAALLLPHSSAHGAKPLVFVSKGSSPFHARSDEGLSVPSPEVGLHVVLGVLEHSRDLLEHAISFFKGSILAFDSSSVAVVSRVSDGALPLHVFHAPVSSTIRERLHLSLRHLVSLAALISEGDDLVLFSPTLRKAELVRAPLLDDLAPISVNSSGGEFIISPVHAVSEGERTWRVSLLATHSDASMTVERLSQTHSLPTPPPSPPAPKSLVVSAVGPSLPGSGRSSGLATPTARPSSRGHTEHRRRPSLALARNLPIRLLRAYLHTVFNVVLWFWSVFLKAIVARIVGEGMSRRISNLLGFALSMTAPRTRSPTGHIQAPDAASRSELQSRRGAQLTDIAIASVSAPRPQRPKTPQELIPARVVSRALLSARALQDIQQTSHFAILQGRDAVKDIRATIDGKSLPLSITPIDPSSELYLIEFSQWPEDGQFEMSFECL